MRWCEGWWRSWDLCCPTTHRWGQEAAAGAWRDEVYGASAPAGARTPCFEAWGAPLPGLLRKTERQPACVQVEVDEGSMQESVETKESQSYPGLLSKVRL